MSKRLEQLKNETLFEYMKETEKLKTSNEELRKVVESLEEVAGILKVSYQKSVLTNEDLKKENKILHHTVNQLKENLNGKPIIWTHEGI